MEIVVIYQMITCGKPDGENILAILAVFILVAILWICCIDDQQINNDHHLYPY